MYLNPSKAGECLTNAYAIMKMKPGNEVFIEPNATGRDAMLKVVYDKHRKAERGEIVSIQNPLTRGTSTSTGTSDTGRRAMNLLEAGAIIAAAENRGEGFKHWARFCYDPDRGREWAQSGAWLTRRLALSWAFTNEKGVRKCPDFFQDMAQLCIIEKAHREVTGQPKYSINELCQHLGYKDKDSSNWSRTLRPHWDLMLQILDIHNSMTLSPVGCRILCLLGKPSNNCTGKQRI